MPGTKLSLVSELGGPGVPIPQKYNKGTIVRRYTEAMSNGITEDDLIQDIQWMREQARLDGDPATLMKLWKFIMEYTVGKPSPRREQERDTASAIIEAMKVGAEYVVQFGPVTGDSDEDSQPGDVPVFDGASESRANGSSG